MTVSLDIHEQPRLPLRKQVEICADGIHHRLFRSAVTVSVVALAIAFLMNVLTESIVVRSVKRGVFTIAREATELPRFNRFVTGPIDAETFRWQLDEAEPDSWQLATLTAWLQTDASHVNALRARSQEAGRHMDWLANLSIAHQRILLARRSPHETMQWLATPKGADAFREAVAETPSVAEPVGLIAFADEYDAWLAEMKRANDKINNRTAVALNNALDRLASTATSPQARQSIEQSLTQQGVAWTAPLLDRLTSEAWKAMQHQHLIAMLSEAELARAWQRDFAQMPDHETILRELAASSATCEWLATHSTSDKLSAAEIQAAAQQLTAMRDITSLRDELITTYGKEEGINTNVFWLTVVSFLVCVVGITNAMLVSVIERFREIATMKCLGALDGFIAVLFLLEASFFGAVGGIIGVVAGLLIGTIRMWASFGQWVTTYWPWRDVFAAAGFSLLAGLGLATVAAIYPAYRASRMPPMEAMRIE